MHEWLAELLSRTGFMPTWRARGRENELQLHIPQEGLGVGVTLALFLDFLCTSARIPILHLEMLLQAERLGLLDKEVLRSKAP